MPDELNIPELRRLADFDIERNLDWSDIVTVRQGIVALADALEAERAAHADTKRERDLLAGLLDQGTVFYLPNGAIVFEFVDEGDDDDAKWWKADGCDTGFGTAIEAIRYAMKQEVDQ